MFDEKSHIPAWVVFIAGMLSACLLFVGGALVGVVKFEKDFFSTLDQLQKNIYLEGEEDIQESTTEATPAEETIPMAPVPGEEI